MEPVLRLAGSSADFVDLLSKHGHPLLDVAREVGFDKQGPHMLGRQLDEPICKQTAPCSEMVTSPNVAPSCGRLSMLTRQP